MTKLYIKTMNVNFLAFPHLRSKIRFFGKVKYKKIENKNKLFFYNLKIITALRNQILITIILAI